MKARHVLYVLTCICLLFTVETLVAVPNRQPAKDKDAEAKELLAEHKALRQRLEQVEKRLAALNSLPVWVRPSHPCRRLETGGVDRVLHPDKMAYLNIVLSTDPKTWHPVAGRLFKDKLFSFEVEIPHRDVKQGPIRVIGSATADNASEMEGSFLVPNEAKLGHVAITLSWVESGRIVQGKITQRVYIGKPK